MSRVIYVKTVRPEEPESLPDILGFLLFLGVILVVVVVYILPIAVFQTLTEWLEERREI